MEIRFVYIVHTQITMAHLATHADFSLMARVEFTCSHTQKMMSIAYRHN